MGKIEEHEGKKYLMVDDYRLDKVLFKIKELIILMTCAAKDDVKSYRNNIFRKCIISSIKIGGVDKMLLKSWWKVRSKSSKKIKLSWTVAFRNRLREHLSEATSASTTHVMRVPSHDQDKHASSKGYITSSIICSI